MIRCKNKASFFWNNDSGWGSLVGAVFFNDEDLEMLTLPMEGEWARIRVDAP